MILFVNDLTVIDSTYLCLDRGLVGESWIVDLELDGQLDDQSMVLDFGKVKKQVKNIIDDVADHKLLVPQKHAQVEITEKGDLVSVFAKRPQGNILHTAPKSAYAFIDAEKVCHESLTQFVRDAIQAHLPENIEGIRVSLRAEAIDGPFYHYTHGLKKHDGNCQRIAHGHRSKLQVFVDGEDDEVARRQWCQRWQDIYLGSAEDEVSIEEGIGECSSISKDDFAHHIAFAYEAPQGFFSIVLPIDEVEVIPCDSTVERLAQYISTAIKQQKPECEIKVMAYEGVAKGAIAYA